MREIPLTKWMQGDLKRRVYNALLALSEDNAKWPPPVFPVEEIAEEAGIPANLARAVLESLRRQGKVLRRRCTRKSRFGYCYGFTGYEASRASWVLRLAEEIDGVWKMIGMGYDYVAVLPDGRRMLVSKAEAERLAERGEIVRAYPVSEEDVESLARERLRRRQALLGTD